MTSPIMIGIDTETGGLDQRLHPLLSVALIVADENVDRIPGLGFEVKILPQHGTVLEIPAPGSYGREVRNKKILGYMDVWTKQVFDPPGPPGVPVITAGAAEINKYKGDGPDWKVSDVAAAIDLWHSQGREITQAETDLVEYLTGPFETRNILTVAHNAIFDRMFLEYSMPRLSKRLDPWFCTMLLSRKYWALKQLGKQSSKLVDMAKVANHDYGGKAHEAISDVLACLAVLKYLRGQPEWEQLAKA
jgi:DNA polymerase III epsilon subunit-like protein